MGSVNKSIAFWLDYLGGVEVFYLILTILAVTQLVKMLAKAFGKLLPDTIRPVPYVAGAFLGWIFIDFSARGAMIGVSAGMIASLGFYALTAWLEREGAADWQKSIADRISLR